MKKTILRIVFLVMVSTNCIAQENVSKVSLKTLNDSLNYTLGYANGDGIKNYYFKNLNTDQAITNFMKWLDLAYHSSDNGIIRNDSTNEYFSISQVGNKIGTELKKQLVKGLMGYANLRVDYDLIKQGIFDGMKGSESVMKLKDAIEFLPKAIKKIEEKRLTPGNRLNKIAGEEFLSKNKKRPGVKTTNTGLQYEIGNYGTGPFPTDSNTVKVRYNGTLIDGTPFDSLNSIKPVEFPVNKVIKGWSEALKLMPVGSKFKVYIPQELGYGFQECGIIKPYSTLVIEIELLDIE
jgi:FKBP-type peptidyl-prolyl cis-trans isomerase FklB